MVNEQDHMHTTSFYFSSFFAYSVFRISHFTFFVPPNTLAAHISLNICKLKQSLSKAEPKYSFNDQQHVATGFAEIQNPKEIRT